MAVNLQRRQPLGEFRSDWSWGPAEIPWRRVLAEAATRAVRARRDLDELSAVAERAGLSADEISVLVVMA